MELSSYKFFLVHEWGWRLFDNCPKFFFLIYKVSFTYLSSFNNIFKMNIIEQLQFELNHYNVKIQRDSHHLTRTPPYVRMWTKIYKYENPLGFQMIILFIVELFDVVSSEFYSNQILKIQHHIFKRPYEGLIFF